MFERLVAAEVTKSLFSVSDCEFVVELAPNASKSTAQQLGMKIQGDTICIIGRTKKCEFSVMGRGAGIMFSLSDSPPETLFWSCSLALRVRNSAGEIIWEAS